MCLHNSNGKKGHSKGLFVSERVTIQVHRTPWLTFLKISVVQIQHFLWGHHGAFGFLFVYKIGCNSGLERSFSFKLSPSWTAAIELANHMVNMARIQLVFGSPKFTFHILKYSWTGSSLPVNIYAWATSCPKLHAFYCIETPVANAENVLPA